MNAAYYFVQQKMQWSALPQVVIHLKVLNGKRYEAVRPPLLFYMHIRPQNKINNKCFCI